MIKNLTRNHKNLLILLLLSLMFKSSFAQSSLINLDVKDRPIIEIFKKIEVQTTFKFSYDQSEINLNQKISLQFKGNLDNFLKELGLKSGLDFQIVGQSISVRQKVSLPSRMITGVVIDKTDGQTIPGANIFIKGTRKGAVTNINGEFTFKITDANINEVVLSVSFLGMKPKDVKVGDQSYFKIELDRDAIMMNDVVVTSSFTKERRREEVVGSISQLNATQLQTDRPIESFDKMMEGLIAGVQVETNTELGTPVKVNIRGLGSLPTFGSSKGTSSQPLYVLDGIPLYEQQKKNEATVFNGETYLNPLANINPDDIQSISVLKDATASALYGANAANGVIIITTKKGQAGKTKVNVGYDVGVSEFINQYIWLDGNEYYRLLREAYINGGYSATQASQLAGSPDVNTDWFDITTRNASYQNFTFDVSGGKEGTTFRFSSGYRKDNASSLGNNLQKVYARLKIDHQFNDKFNASISLSPTFTQKNGLSTYGGVILPPNVSAVAPDGSYPDILGVPNPFAILTQNQDYHNGLGLLGSVNLGYKLSESIRISGTIGNDNYQNKETIYLSKNNATGRSKNGSLQIYDRNYNGITGFLQATYDHTFNDKHTVNLLFGTQVENKITNLLRGSGTNFNFDRLRVLGAAQTQTSASSKSSDAALSYYSQVGYDLSKKYFATLNARIDESSVFGGDKQVALNGSLGLSWIISKEDFLKDNKVINLLRFRATYGSTGNSRIGTYAAHGLYDFGTSSGNFYNGNFASTPDGTAAPNPDLGWETNNKLNFGLDINLFNRIQIVSEYYSNTVKNLISAVNIPYETGFSTVLANTSTMRNSGLELTINSENININKFSWQSAFNFGFNRNKLLAFNNGLSSYYSSKDDASAFKIGQSSTAIYGYEWAGVNSQTGAEQFLLNGNLVTASAINQLPNLLQTVVLGDRLPKFQGGFVNSFGLGKFNLSFNILYSYGASKLIYYADEADGRNLQNRNQSINLLDRWQKPGDITDIPRLLIQRSIVSNSSRYVYDVSYLKFSNLSMGYQLPKKWLSTVSLSGATFNASINNIFYLYKDMGTKNRNGIAEKRFIFPESRTYVLGLKLNI